jgi:glutamate/tyrosine decarboxylase-like PLP-dependent enzyme
MPGLSHWQSPRFFSYFPCSTSVPSQLADILVSGFGVLGFQWIASPACTELEVRRRERRGISS